jgi:hypothetical protein
MKQLRYALAQLGNARNEISSPELDQAKSDYTAATKALQVFWDTKLPTD